MTKKKCKKCEGYFYSKSLHAVNHPKNRTCMKCKKSGDAKERLRTTIEV